MGVRKNVRMLDDDERKRFVDAMLQLKANGRYDQYVALHRTQFVPGSPGHNGPGFLPWHREYLVRLEQELQAIDPDVSLPYWDWTTERGTGAPLWTEDLLGGDGTGPDDAVQTGRFAFGAGRWTLTVTSPPLDPGPALRRTLGSPNQLPTPAQLENALAPSTYDVFRQRLEFVVHGVPHNWVGRTMAAGTSPNDPVFWLHHCMVDLQWARWQRRHPDRLPYLPAGQGPVGHRLDDPIAILGHPARTPRQLVDHEALGYSYDHPELATSPVDLTVGAPPLPAAIGAAGEIDRYRFVVAGAGQYVVETSGQTDVVMSLLGPNDPEALVAEDDDGGQDRNARIVAFLSAGTYFVRVRHFDPTAAGTYAIGVQGAPVAQPVEIPVNGAPVAGRIDAANESDVYTFAATVPAVYTIETSGITDTFLTLFGPGGQTDRLAVDDDSGPGTNSRVVIDLAAGIYVVRIRHFAPTGTGDYSVRVRR